LEEPNTPEKGGNGGVATMSPETAAGEEERLARYAAQLGIPFKKQILEDFNFEDSLDIPIQYFKRLGLIPLSRTNGVLTVALNDPSQFQAADDLAHQVGCESVRFILSPLKEIHAAINLLFDQAGEDTEKMVQDLEASDLEGSVCELEELEDLLDVSHDAPVIRVVNMILTQALRRDASDIHIEPFEREVKVRFRIDGILYESLCLPKRFYAHIVSRFKIMASLDIAERRVPQDGRMKIKVADKTVDVRVSVIPMAFGERIVLRLLDKGVSLRGLEDMGFAEAKM